MSLTMGSSTSLLPTAIFLLLFSARHPDLVGECVAGLTLLCQQSDIALSFSRLHRISSRATVRRNPGEPFLLARFRARGDASKDSYRRSGTNKQGTEESFLAMRRKEFL
jgi:hypothetical protein